jgi:hypothetical protein
MTADEFAVQKLPFASNPWRIVHTSTGQTVSIPRSLVNADGKTVSFRGSACFPRKRDAVAWLRDELPALLAEKLTTEAR